MTTAEEVALGLILAGLIFACIDQHIRIRSLERDRRKILEEEKRHEDPHSRITALRDSLMLRLDGLDFEYVSEIELNDAINAAEANLSSLLMDLECRVRNIENDD